MPGNPGGVPVSLSLFASRTSSPHLSSNQIGGHLSTADLAVDGAPRRAVCLGRRSPPAALPVGGVVLAPRFEVGTDLLQARRQRSALRCELIEVEQVADDGVALTEAAAQSEGGAIRVHDCFARAFDIVGLG